MKLIDKDALVAELKKRIDEHNSLANAAADNNLYNTLESNELLIRSYKNLMSFLDTLEVKEVQEEPVSEDLEEAADNALSNVLNTHEIINIRSCLKMFRYGAKWQKEQLMKDAVYGLVCGHDESSPAWIDLNLLNKPNVKVGTEVKLIIIKDE